MDATELMKIARKARQNAYAPYSHFALAQRCWLKAAGFIQAAI